MRGSCRQILSTLRREGAVGTPATVEGHAPHERGNSCAQLHQIVAAPPPQNRRRNFALQRPASTRRTGRRACFPHQHSGIPATMAVATEQFAHLARPLAPAVIGIQSGISPVTVTIQPQVCPFKPAPSPTPRRPFCQPNHDGDRSRPSSPYSIMPSGATFAKASPRVSSAH